MPNTMELFEKALSQKKAAAWARQFNLTPSAFSQAKKQGRLSPVLAGNFAIELGEDAKRWMAIASMEAEKDSELLARLKRDVKLYFHPMYCRNKGRVPVSTRPCASRHTRRTTMRLTP